VSLLTLAANTKVNGNAQPVYWSVISGSVIQGVSGLELRCNRVSVGGGFVGNVSYECLVCKFLFHLDNAGKWSFSHRLT
jgi:hypothetical protein